MNKLFVSLYFTPDHFQVLQLNRSGKVVQIASVALPSGLIVKYMVQDKESLAKILKSTWRKLNIRERSLGIVIPEFTTLTKLIKVPKLVGEELNEAIQWQMQEYLPYGFSDAIADWKIARKDENNIEVLSVIAPKESVLGYVDAAESAGLFPIAVATPSIVLSDLLKKESQGCIFVFKGEKESLVLLKQAELLLGSSVVLGGSEDELVRTIKRIMSHYGEVKVEKIVLGGLVGEAEVKTLTEKVMIPIEWASPELKGVAKNVVQEYLIPLAFQRMSAYEPQDVTTVNLLPPPLIVKYNSARRRLQVWSLTLFTTFFVWLCFFAVLGTYFYLNNQIASVKAIDTNQSVVLKERQDAVKSVEKINSTVDRVVKIREATVYPETLFAEITATAREGITLTGYKFDLDIGQITLRGIALDRTKLADFRKELEKNPNVSAVNIPISNLEAETNVEITITYDYLPIVNSNTEKK